MGRSVRQLTSSTADIVNLPLSVYWQAECYDEASRNGLGRADAVMTMASFIEGAKKPK